MILNYYNDLVYQPSELFLNKDFGQVATVLGNLHNLKTVHLICSNTINKDLTNFSGNEVFQAKKVLRRLPSKIDFIKNIRAYSYLWRNKRKFSTLVLFPFTPVTDLIILLMFLALNPGAKVIMKLDANIDDLEKLQESYKLLPNHPLRQHTFYRQLLKIADVVIYETRKVGQLLKDGNFLDINSPHKYVNIFNGISIKQIPDGLIMPKAPSYRNKVITFSGRLSAPEKNVELIFKADPVPPDWKINFIGPIDSELEKIIGKYRSSIEQFDQKYGFFGEIKNKEEYYRKFSEGRILLLSSNKEGFPMVYSEAHYFGLYIITSDVSGASEATDGGRIGTIFRVGDLNGLVDAINFACTRIDINEAVNTAKDYAKTRFVWEHSLRAPEIERLFKKSSDGISKLHISI